MRAGSISNKLRASVARAVTIATMGAAAMAGLYAQADSALQPMFRNDRVLLWDVSAGAQLPDLVQTYDSVVVHMMPASLQGQVMFVPAGGGVGEKLKASGAQRSAVVSLLNVKATPFENTSGYPEAFPRAGKLKKALDNDKVTVWDYTFDLQKPTVTHFHTRDVVAVSLGATPAELNATTPDGVKSVTNYSFGVIRFNPRGRLHSEVLMKGDAHIIAIELK